MFQIISPKAVEAEESLLAAGLIAETAPPCRPEEFTSETRRAIAAAMIEIEKSGSKVDMVSVAERLQGIVTASDIAQITSCMGSSDNLEVYARIVREYFIARSLQQRSINFVSELGNPNGKGITEIVGEFGADVLRMMGTGRKDRDSDMKDGLKAFLSQLDERMNSGRSITGLPTGISKLDAETCGMCPQDLWVIAARPSIGKTALSLQIAVHSAERGAKILFFSQDMRTDSLFQRIMAMKSRVNMQKIRSGMLTREEYARVVNSVARFSQLDFVITDSPATELDIIRKCRKYRPDLVVVDYLQKIVPSKATGNNNTDYGLISKLMKDIAKELDVPVLLLSQLNRAMDKESRAPRLSDLRDTGQIEQDADVVLFIHAPDNDKKAGTRILLLDKQRQGECATYDMAFLGAFQTFEPLSYEAAR